MIQLFDSHCHVDEERFDADRAEALRRMREAGVTRYTVVGSDMATSRRGADFAKAHEGCYAAVGIHPHEAKTYQEGDLALLAAWLQEEKVRALGEIGLDYYYDHSPRDKQREICEWQMDLAYRLEVPAVFHIRDAHGDMLALMKTRQGRLPGGIIHCFSGSWESAKEYLKLGYYLSFAGPLTFKKAPHLWETAQRAPLDRLLVETDSPYLAPEPNRGRRNEPAYVCLVAQKLAQLRGLPYEEMCRIVTENACRVYRIKA